MLKSDYKENLPSNQQDDNTMEILVMDNNILLINLLGKSLIQDDIKITSVADVENAVKILKERIFDVVLFDGPNDDYSKEAILELFDKNGFLQDQRIVLFSGATQSSFIEKWKAKGLYSYIEKPTSTQKILEFLQVVKNESRPKKILNSQMTQEQEMLEGNIETSMIVEDEATPEQLAKVEELTKQIDELEKNYNSKVSKNIKQHHTENHSDTPKKQFPQTTFETDSNSEFKKILSRLSSIKNQFLYNTSNVSSVSQIQITEDELFNLKKEISKVRRKVYRTRPKQKNTKSTSSQKKKDKKRHTSKKKRK